MIASTRVEDSRRENTRQDFLSQTSPLFEENRSIHRLAVEGLLPTGGEVRIGGEMNRLNNNLQTTLDREYVSFLGITIRQPLLKDAGLDTTMAQIRVAEKETEVVLNETRREMMGILSQAEIAYWELFQFTMEYELRQESARIARNVLEENRERVAAGQMSEVEIMRAEAELAIRQTQVAAAMQRRLDASARLKSFLAQDASGPMLITPADTISIEEENQTIRQQYEQALENHPTLMALRKSVEQESLREDYARNQRLPDLSLSASYGLSGLGDSFSRTRSQLWNDDFYSWFVGLEFEMPILNRVRGVNQYEAARLRRESAEHRLRGAELELANLIRAVSQRVDSLRDQVEDYQEVVRLQERLLNAQLEALELGRGDSRMVFEAEQDYTDARLAVIESQVRYQRRLIEREILLGTYLANKGMDLI